MVHVRNAQLHCATFIKKKKKTKKNGEIVMVQQQK